MHPADERLNRPGGLAERMYRLRKASGRTGDQLAADMGWPAGTGRTKVSKIEHGKQVPSAGDIRAWTAAAGHPEQADELLELLADVQTVHTRWRRRLREGHAAVQEDIGRRTRAAKRIRNAELVLIPGLLQTAGYARSIVTQVSDTYGTQDIDATVAARMQRQAALYDQSKTFEFVMTEAALRLFPCAPPVMLGQLDRLLSMDLPNVTLGIIPFGQVPVMPFSAFLLLDDDLTTETWSGKDDEPAGDESAVHARIFEGLIAEAVTGDEARRLIAAAAAGLRES